jgi:diketogulonate reductase-like aldo/keto reductase
MPYDPRLSIADQVHASVTSSLANLAASTGTDTSYATTYLDCVLLHSPLPKREGTAIAWIALSSYVASGKIRHLGIANVSLPVLDFLVNHMEIKPSVVQNRFYPDSNPKYEVQLRRLCREQGIVFQSFWTLTGNPGLLKSEVVKELAKEVGVSVQVALYALVVGLEKVTVLDGTTNEERMVEDLEGLVKVGRWAEGEGREGWERILEDFRKLIGDL